MKKPIILEFWAQSNICTLQINICALCILRVWRDLRLSQRLDRLKHWRLPLCFTYLRPRWYYIMASTTRSLIGICWNLGGCWRRPMLFSLAVLFTGSRFFAIIAEYQNKFYQIKQLVFQVQILFPSNHNIHKSSYGLCFLASDPLIDRFY